MRTVFSDISQIAHLFANQLQDEAKNPQRNFYFEGNTIYSYSTAIGKIVNGSVLLSEHRYSNTTSKQQSVLRQACSHLNIVYCEYVNGDNFNYWVNECGWLCLKLKTARKPEKYLAEIELIKNKAERYAEFMGRSIPETLSELFKVTNSEDFALYTTKKAEIAEKQAKDREIRLKKEHSKALKVWKAGKTDRLYTHNGFDYLRLKNSQVQTTQGIKIGLDKANSMYHLLKSGKLKEGMTIEDVHNYPYTIQHVGKNHIQIGCHKFKTSYLLNFGKTQLFP